MNQEPIIGGVCKGSIGLGTACKRCAKCAVEMQSRIAELEKDAARFKWCLNQYGFADFIIHDIGKFCDTPEQMRQAIDTAMQKD